MFNEDIIENLKKNDKKANYTFLKEVYLRVVKFTKALIEEDKTLGEGFKASFKNTLASFCGDHQEFNFKLYTNHKNICAALKMLTIDSLDKSSYMKLCNNVASGFNSLGEGIYKMPEYDGFKTDWLLYGLFTSWFYALRDFNFDEGDAEILNDYEERIDMEASRAEIFADNKKPVEIVGSGFTNYMKGNDKMVSIGVILENPNPSHKPMVGRIYIRAYDKNSNLAGKAKLSFHNIGLLEQFNIGTCLKAKAEVAWLDFRVITSGFFDRTAAIDFSSALATSKVELKSILFKPVGINVGIVNNGGILTGPVTVYGVLYDKDMNITGGFDYKTKRLSHKSPTITAPYPFKRKNHDGININYTYDMIDYIYDYADNLGYTLPSVEEVCGKEDTGNPLLDLIGGGKDDDNNAAAANMVNAFIFGGKR